MLDKIFHDVLQFYNNLEKNEYSFDEIEKNIFEEFRRYACEFTKILLEAKDKKLSNNREKKLINKGKRLNTIKSLYGDISYKRRIYKVGEKYEYILDERLGISEQGKYSNNIKKLVLQYITKDTYREVAKKISDKFTSISHQAVWDIVNEYGNGIYTKEVNQLDDYNTRGKIKTNVLFEEVDGVYINIKGSKKQEIKLSSVYTSKDKDNHLKDVLFFGGFYSTSDFHFIREKMINNTYDINEKTTRILNTDGAKWCKNIYGKADIRILDSFHVMKAITTYTDDKKLRYELIEAYKKGHIYKLIELLEDSIEKEISYKKKKRLEKLYTYLYENRDDLLPLKFRNSQYKDETVGIQESMNYILVASRMKNRRMSFTKKGATNLLKIMCEHYSTAKTEYKKTISKEKVIRRKDKYNRNNIYEEKKENIPLLNQSVRYSKWIRGLI